VKGIGLNLQETLAENGNDHIYVSTDLTSPLFGDCPKPGP